MSNTDNKRLKTVDGYFKKPIKKSYIETLEETYSSLKRSSPFITEMIKKIPVFI